MTDVGLLWAITNIIACVFVLTGFIWLRFFEKKEIVFLEKCSVSPADYTVKVSNLPENCTELDLRVYFARLMNESVCDIIFVADEEEDIELFKKRGTLVKKRYQLTQVRQ
jgi:hypothetical protein